MRRARITKERLYYEERKRGRAETQERTWQT
jgi:hypothetical protein